MKKIFIDSNIWIRLLSADHKQMFADCQTLFHLNQLGKLKLYTSNIVLLETHFVMTKTYGVAISEMTKDLKKILQTRNLTLIEKTNFRKALQLHLKTKVKLADCLIATQLPPNSAICTYDKDFKKLKIQTTTPDKIKKSLLN